ncbi:hypothetical protein LQ327_22255 [Actinomycetospora endophytica]|uniref:Dolichyl-phosphate-mannose-protein mannosyltransferase n=1 Tax=Actinomycetospora endophytica TaxID=2291215 RepID=A0ABS8PD58_9PSEU|nr:hypothetical protein [Actinomycetospora endophytica]MCD2196099.1 hypothetical protein [Actinomycetospora endophytica]
MTAAVADPDAQPATPSEVEPVPTTARPDDPRPWGHLPETSVLVVTGLLAVSLAYAGGRAGAGWWVDPVYWLGQLLLFVPPLLRILIGRRVTERECAGTAMVLGSAYFVAAWCYSPLEFKFIDELQNWRTTTDIVQNGHLFSYNDSLPISPMYPGLESVTAAVVVTTGLSVFVAGVVVMGLVRVVLTAGLYLFFRKVTSSARAAALASILFTAAPYYKSVLAKFIYGSMALPFLVLACYAAMSAITGPASRRRTMTGLAVVAIAVTVISHHLTSWFLTATLLVALLVFSYRGDRVGIRVLSGLSVTSGVLIGTWILAVAPTTPAYLSPALTDLTRGIAAALGGRSQQSDGGFVRAPLSEALPSYACVLVLAVGVALSALWVWRRHRSDPWIVVMTLAALGYLAVPVIRVLSDSGSEDAVRAQSYLFIAVAPVLSLCGLEYLRRAGRPRWLVSTGAVVATVVMIGGITSGWPPAWGRIPADHMVVDGYENAVDPQGVAAAYWVQASLPTGQRMAADDTNYTLMGPYGQQTMVSGTSGLYRTSTLTEADRAEIVADRVQYLVADRRLTQQLPAGGSYFPDDPMAFRYTSPLPLADLTKFDRVPGVARLFDSGDLVIYDLRSLDGAP